MNKSESIKNFADAMCKFQGEVKNPPKSASNELIVGFDHKNIKFTISGNGCYVCTSHYKDKDGYPKITFNKKQRIMSRYIYERFVGEIPKNKVIRHKCDCASCINPNHLEIGTQDENINDKVKRNRQASGGKIGVSKLDKEKVIQIRNLTGSISSIARMFGVNHSTISRVKKYETWRNCCE
ncbi:MAG TPA: HNH endonuclease [Ruminiclostridium sp.]